MPLRILAVIKHGSMDFGAAATIAIGVKTTMVCPSPGKRGQFGGPSSNPERLREATTEVQGG
jgi:hypothetical protein